MSRDAPRRARQPSREMALIARLHHGALRLPRSARRDAQPQMLRLVLEIARPPPPAHVGWSGVANWAGRARGGERAGEPRGAVLCLQVVNKRATGGHGGRAFGRTCVLWREQP